MSNSIIFHFRISPEDKEIIRKNASTLNLTMSDYVRICSICELGEKIIWIDPQELSYLVRLLKAEGNNLNQLTRIAHRGKANNSALQNQLEETLKNVQDTCLEIMAFFQNLNTRIH